MLSSRNDGRIVLDPRSFVASDGRLDFRMLLEEFIGFWRENAEVLITGTTTYPEAAPQLVIMAYLHRVVNGGGLVEREFGAGRGRIDLVVRWPFQSAAGKRMWQREAIELKVWRAGRKDPLIQGLRQLDEFLQRLDLDHGPRYAGHLRPAACDTLVRPPGPPQREENPTGRTVTLLRA